MSGGCHSWQCGCPIEKQYTAGYIHYRTGSLWPSLATLLLRYILLDIVYLCPCLGVYCFKGMWEVVVSGNPIYLSKLP